MFVRFKWIFSLCLSSRLEGMLLWRTRRAFFRGRRSPSRAFLSSPCPPTPLGDGVNPSAPRLPSAQLWCEGNAGGVEQQVLTVSCGDRCQWRTHPPLWRLSLSLTIGRTALFTSHGNTHICLHVYTHTHTDTNVPQGSRLLFWHPTHACCQL